MADLLVRLYELPDVAQALKSLADAGVTVRRAMAYERQVVTDWVRSTFSPGWAAECESAFSGPPVTCYVATEGGSLLGFACYDCTCRGFFGPIGVDEGARNRGIGRGLLLACLRSMEEAGYGYAVVGGAASEEFYRGVVEVWEIPGSTPGVYRDRLR